MTLSPSFLFADFDSSSPETPPPTNLPEITPSVLFIDKPELSFHLSTCKYCFNFFQFRLSYSEEDTLKFFQ